MRHRLVAIPPHPKRPRRPETPCARSVLFPITFDSTTTRRACLAGIARQTIPLGLASFGGPIAHFGYFHRRFVLRQQWLSESEFAELVALCQFLPGPASSQFIFELGRRRAGWAGALLAAFCFTAPSAAIMITLAVGVGANPSLAHAGFVHGFKLAAVGAVAQALWSMSRRLCPDWPRVLLALAAGVLVLWRSEAWAQPAIIAGAGLVGLAAPGLSDAPEPPPTSGLSEPPDSARRTTTFLLLVAFGAMLVLPGLVSQQLGWPMGERFEAIYRSGALVFGGGHVVLPMLERRIVDPGWISQDTFLAGYGAAQAVPGPLFSFGAFLGATIAPGMHPVLGGVLGLIAIFLPGWLLIGAAGPLWASLSACRVMRRAVVSVNAAVVGLLGAALYNPLATTSLHSPADAAIALAAFGALLSKRVPPVVVVIACGLLGQLLPAPSASP
ncbi:MAG: chromate efflux transporter [Tepidisphaera sp.]|nr:chromate efflux transporter [Tepidisphaera sp.]